MNVTSLVTQVKRQYGDEYGVIVTDDDLMQFIYEGEMDIIRNTGCFELKVLGGIFTSSFPLEIPQTVQIVRVSVDDVPLTFISSAELDLFKAALNTDKGTPKYWYMMGVEVMHLYPTSTSPTTGVEIHYKHTAFKQATPTGELQIPERYHTDLLQFCLAKCHNKNRDAQSEQSAMNVYSQNLALRREEGYSFEGPIYKQPDPADWDY